MTAFWRRCGCCQKTVFKGVHALISTGNLKWGKFVARRPLAVLVMVAMLYVVCLPGLLLLEGEAKFLFVPVSADWEALYAPEKSVYRADFEDGSALFPPPLTAIVAQSGSGSVLDTDFVAAAYANDRHIRTELTGSLQGVQATFQDACEKTGNSCLVRTVFELLPPLPVVLRFLNNTPNVLDRAHLIVSLLPVEKRPLLKLLLGNPTMLFPGKNATEDALVHWLATSQTLLGLYYLHPSPAQLAFEQGLLDFKMSNEGPLDLAMCLPSSYGPEIAKLTTSIAWLLIGTVVVMVVYACLMLGFWTRKEGDSQFLLVALGALLPLLGVFGSWGLMGYLGLPLNVISILTPFMVLANGLDELFVLVSALQRQKDVQEIPEVVGTMLATGGASVAVSSITSLVCFGIATLTSIGTVPFLFSYNLNLVLAVILNWAGMLMIFPVLVTLKERRSAQVEVSSCRAASLRWINPAKPLVWFWDSKMPFLFENHRSFRLIGAVLSVALIAAGSVAAPHVRRAMVFQDVLKDDSYLMDVIGVLNGAFHGERPSDGELVLPSPLLEDAGYRHSLIALVGRYQSRADVVWVDCWPTKVRNLTDQLLGSKLVAIQRDVRLAAGPQPVVQAARCHVWFMQPTAFDMKVQQAEELASLARGADIPAILHHSTFYVDVSLLVETPGLIWSTLAYTILGVFASLLFVLPWLLAFAASCGVAGVLASLLGYMYLAGVGFSVTTLAMMVIGAGFCVDYFTHVCFFAVNGPAALPTWTAKMRHSLECCGYAIFQGATISCLSVLLILLFGKSKAARLFGQVMTLLSLVGGLLALYGMPSLIALADCGFHHEAEPKPDARRSENFPSPRKEPATINKDVILSWERDGFKLPPVALEPSPSINANVVQGWEGVI